MANERFEYHVLISFAGPDRAIAKELAEHLQSNGLRVFYDEYERSQLWGKDLYQYFHHLYSKGAIYCVVLLSEEYKVRRWTNHELRSAQERVFEEKQEYILPLILEDVDIPGIPKTIGYLDARDLPIAAIAVSVLEKVTEYSKKYPHSVAAADNRSGRTKSTIVRFIDDEYKSTENPKFLDISVDTGFIEYALWAGDDIEIWLSSSHKHKQSEGMGYHFLSNYKLEFNGRCPKMINGDGPVTWSIKIDAMHLSDNEVCDMLRQIVQKHNEMILSLRQQYYANVEE